MFLSSGTTYHMLPSSQVNNCIIIIVYITTFKLTAVASSNCSHFLKDLIFEYFDMEQKRSTEGCSKLKSPETRQVQ